MNRRDFIKSSLLMAAYALLWDYKAVFGENIATKKKDLLIIGAGVSGIAAARELQSKGFNVTILEGRTRIGGRIWTDESLGYPVDLGASWIQGADKNPITSISRQYNIETYPTNYDNIALYDKDGQPVSDEETEMIYKTMTRLIKEVMKRSDFTNKNASIGGAMKQVRKGMNLSVRNNLSLNWAIATHVVTAGAEMEKLSLSWPIAERGFGGEDYFFPDGYNQIIQKLATNLNIKLKHQVTKIEYNKNGVKVTTSQGVFNADAVLVTLPIGVLKAQTVQFEPQLPKSKLGAIQRLGVGNLSKVALSFPKAFWSRDRDFIGYISETQGEFPVFFNMYKYIKAPVLIGFVGGNYATNLENSSKADIVNKVMRLLKKIYGVAAKEPLKETMWFWRSDAYAYGAYSYLATGSEGDEYEIMEEPVQDRLFFAGEATIQDYPGTAHGAFLSGIREAKKIIHLYS